MQGTSPIPKSISPPTVSSLTFPVNMKRTITAGWIVTLATLGGFIGWSVLAPLTTAVVGAGSVAIDGNRKNVEHLQGGIVEKLLVRDGDSVRAGQILIGLDDTEPRASVQLLKGRLNEARATEARLLAERNRHRKIIFPPSLEENGNLSDTSSIRAGQEQLFKVRNRALDGQKQIYERQIQQYEARIEGRKKHVGSLARQAALIDSELAGLAKLTKRGLTSVRRLRGVQREREEIIAKEGNVQAEIQEITRRIGEAELQIAQLEKGFQQEVETKLQEIRAQILDFSERLQAAQMRLARLEIRAPVSGKIVNLSLHTVGGVISPGETIMEIVPTSGQLIIEAQIQPDDIDSVAVGMPVDISFPGFSSRSLPPIQGEMTTVSADRLIDQVTKTSYFLIRVRVDDEQRAELAGHGLQLLPGMPAMVMVKSGQKTLFEYISQPIRESFAKAMIE